MLQLAREREAVDSSSPRWRANTVSGAAPAVRAPTAAEGNARVGGVAGGKVAPSTRAAGLAVSAYLRAALAVASATMRWTALGGGRGGGGAKGGAVVLLERAAAVNAPAAKPPQMDAAAPRGVAAAVKSLPTELQAGAAMGQASRRTLQTCRSCRWRRCGRYHIHTSATAQFQCILYNRARVATRGW